MSCCKKMGNLPELNETYSCGDFAIHITGPYPQGTKSLFIDIKPALILRRKIEDYYIDAGSDMLENLPEWLQDIADIDGFVQSRCIKKTLGILEFSLAQYHRRESIVCKIGHIIQHKYLPKKCGEKSWCQWFIRKGPDATCPAAHSCCRML